MKIRDWPFATAFLVPLLFMTPKPLGAQVFSFEVMGGSAYNLPTPLTVRQAGYPDINLWADYDTKPFGPYTPYYVWRAALWDKNEAWEFEQVHHRIFLTNPPPEIQDFSIHFGYNYFLLGHAWKKEGFILHLGAGPVITNPQNTVRGQKLRTYGTGWFDQGYNLSGAGAQGAISRNFYYAKNGYFLLEVALIAGWVNVPVVNGSADVPNIAFHGHIGTGVSF